MTARMSDEKFQEIRANADHDAIDREARRARASEAAALTVHEDEMLRRIVACVNACAGLSTEALERGMLADLLNDIRGLDGAGQFVDDLEGK